MQSQLKGVEQYYVAAASKASDLGRHTAMI